jgi:hypothetical protein
MDWKQKLLAVAIGIIFTAFIFYGVSTFYPQPQYDDFCKPMEYPQYINNSEECVDQGGKWNPNFGPREVPKVSDGYCDIQYECRQSYELGNTKHKKVVFVIALIFGLGAFIGGIFVPVSTVSAGLMGGGILTMLIGILQYWDQLGDVFRFVLLGIILGVLILVGIKKLK